jgi:hypothetical protein
MAEAWSDASAAKTLVIAARGVVWPRNYEHMSRGWCLYLIVVEPNETFRLSRG